MVMLGSRGTLVGPCERHPYFISSARAYGDYASANISLRRDQMSNVLFITTSSSGDVIHYMPAITEARRPHLLTQKMIEFRRVNGQTPTGLLRTRSACC